MTIAPLGRRRDEGFTLVELLAVIIIIGLLAAIAIPLYLDQQKKGHDAAAKNDVNVIAKLVAASAAETNILPSLSVSGRQVSLNGTVVAALSDGVELGPLVGTDASDWCIDATHPAGDRAKVKGYRFKSSEDKVEEGQCS